MYLFDRMIIGITSEAMSVKLCRTCVAWVCAVVVTDSSSDQPMGPQGGQSPQGAASSGKVQQGRTEHALLEDMPGKVHAEQKEHHGEPRCRLKMKRD